MSAPAGERVIQSVVASLRKSQRKVIALVIQAMAELRWAASIPIAASLSIQSGARLDSALTRFYRLLHNPRIDDLTITRQMLAALARPSASLLIALDWTEWHPPLRMLLASVVSGARAIPVFATVLVKTNIRRSQNCWENTFLRVLAELLNEAHLNACFLADRGFRRVSFLTLLQQHTGHTFLVRLMDNVTAETHQWKRPLSRCRLSPGHAIDLGLVRLRQDAAVEVRVVGVWAKGAAEPWWLATNLEDPLSGLVALYDRRMAIEEQIRDTKGARFGMALVWTQIKTPAALARFALLIGLTMLLLTAFGHAVATRHPDALLASSTKGPRLSFLSIGLLFWPYLHRDSHISKNLHISPDFIKENLPPPALREFPWLSHPRLGKRK